MNFNISKMFKLALYREKCFYISKKDNGHLHVVAKNGLVANIFIADRVMFVEFSIPNHKELLRYATPLGETPLSDKDFIIQSVQKTILFVLPSDELFSYLKKRDEIFSEWSRSATIHSYMRGYDAKDHQLRQFKDDCFYTYTKYENVCYQHVFFSKKKIVKNVFKYSYVTEPTTSSVTYPTSIHYLIGDVFFELCTLSNFITSVREISKYDHKFEQYGIDNQLLAHCKTYKNLLNCDKILLLKSLYGYRNYCSVSRNNGKIVFNYLTNNFNMKYSKFEKLSDHKIKLNKLLGIDNTVQFYELERLITHTYYRGKTKTTFAKFSQNDAIKQESDISMAIMDKIESLKLNYPSTELISKLDELGLSTDIPLNPDDLTVLDMYVI